VTGPLLVTGGSGYLGRELLRRSPGAVGASRGEGLRLDVRDAGAVRAAIERLRPAAVIHTAYRQDDRATTLDGAVHVAEAAAAAGARLIHLSTDVVFDGEKGAPYTEEDEPRPITPYGRDKADAERAVREAHPGALVVRTSLMYGGAEPGPQERMAADRQARFFTDELRSPVHVGDLAAALLELAGTDPLSLLHSRGLTPSVRVLHLAGADALSRFDFARLLSPEPDRVQAATLAGSGLVRPRNCSLSSVRAAALLETRLRGARQVLERGRARP
jgi:dTDP-4-dehydrorhamnose reductase